MTWLKKNFVSLLVLLMALVGVGLLVYPTFSDWWNSFHQSRAVAGYAQAVAELDPDRYKEVFEAAEKYNEKLCKSGVLWNMSDAEKKEYNALLDVNGSGIMGYIDIPKINVTLPIYHGTSDEVLKKGAGHLNNTSLPIGGPGTHSVISAHSAFPSKTLFDYLLDMEEGDLFYIHVLDRVLEYKVDQIKTVLPNDVNDLYVTEGKDYVTLMTCTPYTVNTHRLLVRGERVPDDPDIVVDGDGNKTVDNKAVRAVDSGKSSMYVLGYKLSYVTIIIGIGVFLLVVAAVVVLAVRRGKGRKTKGGES